MDLYRKKFKDVDIEDPFFDSLKNNYSEFCEWFRKKGEEQAYVFEDERGDLSGFLYLKTEKGEVTDAAPPLPAKHRIKIGTFKIDAHGTRLGERFIKKSIDHALGEGAEEIYVTIFEEHSKLVNLFIKYGFQKASTKTTQNGEELVLVKTINQVQGDILKDYPLISLRDNDLYLLGIFPKFHTRLFPDSKLIADGPDMVQDVSHTNSIHKVYLTSMKGVDSLKKGDVLVIYRTNDGKGPAHYRSVASSICVVERYRHISEFFSYSQFQKYCSAYSVFTDKELESFWDSKKYCHIIRFTYNVALKKRLPRKDLIDNNIISSDEYAGFMSMNKEDLSFIAKEGKINESLIVD